MPTNVLNASPNALAECAEKKLYPPPRSRTCRPCAIMNSSLSGRMRPTACLIRFENWSQKPKVSRAPARTMSPRFQPSFQIRRPMIAAYIGAQTSFSEKKAQIGSVINECQLLISRVNSWSIWCISCQVISQGFSRCRHQGRGLLLLPLQAFPSGVPPRACPSAP